MKNIFIILTTLLVTSLVGCATTPSSLYSWGQFPQQTYLSMSVPEKALPQDQMLKLEKDIEIAKAKNRAVPPGLYAHLGLLNLNTNNAPKAAEYFELERQVYPESSVLMERFLSKISGQPKTSAGAKK